MSQRRKWLSIGGLILGLASLGSLAVAQAPAREPLSVAVRGAEGAGRHQLVASVGGPGPMAGVTVHFFAKRTFGLLSLGEADTDDQGMANFSCPADVPGDAIGDVDIVATVDATEGVAGGTGRTRVRWGIPVPVQVAPFPPALWAPRAPREFVAVIIVLLTIVWGTYGFAAYHLAQIPRSKSGESA